MFTKLDRTQYPPQEKPLMAWDGNCGFCHYWVLRWKTFTGDRVEYRPYSEVASNFPDIDLKYFRQAVRLIETDGRIYTGPAAAFQAFQHGKRWRWLMPLYRRFKLIEWFSDRIYAFISKRRPFMYKLTVALWGRNPYRQRNYWAFYVGSLGALVVAALLQQ